METIINHLKPATSYNLLTLISSQGDETPDEGSLRVESVEIPSLNGEGFDRMCLDCTCGFQPSPVTRNLHTAEIGTSAARGDTRAIEYLPLRIYYDDVKHVLTIDDSNADKKGITVAISFHITTR